MCSLVNIIAQLAAKNEVIIEGEAYRIKNIVAATDGELLKSRFILENISSIEKIEIDVGISARMYKR